MGGERLAQRPQRRVFSLALGSAVCSNLPGSEAALDEEDPGCPLCSRPWPSWCRRRRRGRLRQQRRQHHQRRRRRRRTAHGRLRHPLSRRSSNGKTGPNYTGFDIELMEAIAEEDRPHRRNSRTPRSKRSSATSPRASSKPSSRPRRSPTEREETVDFSNPYYLSEQAILVKEGQSDIKRPSDLEGTTVGAQQGTTGQELGEEKVKTERTPPLPRRPGRDQRAEGGHRRRRDHRRPGRRKRGRDDGGLEISGEIETEEQYGIVVHRATPSCSTKSTRALKEVIDSGKYTTIYEKWFHKLEPPGSAPPPTKQNSCF